MMDRRAVVRLVTQRILDGFEPVIDTEGRRFWARFLPGSNRREEHTYTPAEGVIMDELVFLQTDTGAGHRHRHRLHEAVYWHRHEGALRPHRHHLDGGSPDTRGAQPE